MINAAKKFKFNNVVRITGNPLTDIDAIIKMSKSHVKKMRLYTPQIWWLEPDQKLLRFLL